MSERDEDRWTARLTEYMEGDLPRADEEALERHLTECDDCRRTLDELRAVVERARSVEPRPPARDLWPGIAEGIGVSAGPGGRGGVPTARSPRRRVSFTVPQLAAAGLALALASGAGAWALRPAPTPSPALSGAPSAVRPASVPDGSGVSAGELVRLQETLERARGVLEPSTVRVLERNLAVIDRAIAESRAALESDPGNAFLQEHLAQAVRRKAEVLRDVTELVEWSS